MVVIGGVNQWGMNMFECSIKAFIQDRSAFLLCIFASCCAATGFAQTPEPEIAADASTASQPAREDALLRELESDYESLLKNSQHKDQLREAEQLLRELDDRSKWTNYSAATKILRQHRDRAAIPLLLRFCWLHAGASSAHVILPEYRQVISEISGHAIPELYVAGADRVELTRQAVENLTENWWRKFRNTLVVSTSEMDPQQLEVMATQLLERVRKKVDFSGSGGQVGMAYHALHVMYYRMSNPGDEGFVFVPHERLVPIILEKIGYQTNASKRLDQAVTPFPFDVAWILGEFAKHNSAELLQALSEDKEQTPVVRLACMLALLRVSQDVDVQHVLELLKHDNDRQRQMIYLLMLRWFDGDTQETLLEYMRHPDVELATAAACALRDTKPDQAIERFAGLMERSLQESPILLLSELSHYEQQAARDLMEKLLRQSLEGAKHAEHLSRIADACSDSWSIDRSRYRRISNTDAKTYGHLVLELVSEMREYRAEQKRKLEQLVESLQTQVKVAEQIESLRHAEYKRLLLLQGDGVVDVKESMLAAERLRVLKLERVEVAQQLLDGKSQLETFDNRKIKFEATGKDSLFGE